MKLDEKARKTLITVCVVAVAIATVVIPLIDKVKMLLTATGE